MHPRDPNRDCTCPATLRAIAAVQASARRSALDLRKRIARAMLRDPREFARVEDGLMHELPHDLVEHLSALLREARREYRLSDPVGGRTDLANLAGALIAARWIRRHEGIVAMVREAA